jgi:hypothetical protein
VLDLAAADNGEDEGRLGHDVGEGDGGRTFAAELLADLVEREADLLLGLGLAGASDIADLFALLLLLLDVRRGLELACARKAQ